MTNSAYRIILAGFALSVLFISHAVAQDCFYNPYNPTGCPAPQPDPEPGPPEPIPTPTCPDGYQSTPYGCLKPSGPAPDPVTPDPVVPDPVVPDPVSPTPLTPEPQRLGQPIPAPESGHVFSLVLEQGPAFPLTMIALGGPVPAFIWYSPDFGGLWLIVDGVTGPERICTVDQPPGMRLAALDMDNDGQEDLLMHDPQTGLVARFYTRNLNNCQ